MAEALPVEREKREKKAEKSLGARLREDVGVVEVKSVEREERRKETTPKRGLKRTKRSNQAVEAFRAQLMCEV